MWKTEMDFVDFTRTSHTLEYMYNEEQEKDWPEFFELYKDRFPLLAYIVGGNYGETVYDDFCSDQIYRVQTYSNQRRIVAKAAKVYDRFIDIYLSLPIDTKHQFCVLKGHRGKAEAPKTLKDIVESNPFPIQVKFAPDEREIYVGNSREDVSSYATILLTREYTENFILGNCIMNGQVCKTVTVAAISALISVAPVSGINGKSAEFFRRFLSDLQASLADVKYDRTVGNTSITKITPEGTGTGNILPKLDPPLLPVDGDSEDSDDDLYELPIEPSIGPDLPQRTPTNPTTTTTSGNPFAARQVYENAAIVSPMPSTCIPPKVTGGKQHSAVISKKSTKNPASSSLNSSTSTPERKPQSAGDGLVSARGPLPTPKGPLVRSDTSSLFSEGNYFDMNEADDTYETLSSVVPNKEENDSKNGTGIARTEDVPNEEAANDQTIGGKQHLIGLSVEDIGGCLRKLGLDKYVGRFAEDMVDGVILFELTKSDLKAEYGFKAVELIKIWKFIMDGYIPKGTARYTYEYDETQGYNGSELLQKYRDRFPLLAIVTQGDYGKTVFDDFCDDQVYRIHTFTCQRRAVMKETRVKQDPLKYNFVSYPVDTVYKFCVMKSRTDWTEPMTLADILNEYPFPIMVKFSPMCKYVKIHDTMDLTEKISSLLIITAYEETFFTGNCLEKGVIHPGITMAALSPRIEYAEITGIKGKSAETFRKHLNTLERFLKDNDVTFDRTAGNPAVTRMSEEGTGTGNPVPEVLKTLIPELKRKPPPVLPKREMINPKSKQEELLERPLPPIPNQIPKPKPKAVVHPTFLTIQMKQQTVSVDNSSDADYTYLEIENLCIGERTNPEAVRRCLKQSSVSDISKYLVALKLDKYVERFREELIDGEIFVDLTDELLTEFHMQRLEIIRLLMFIKTGHIPR
ncbi:uncharacterized protein LOC117316255 [Pecten maximus]|uniref:uncharacterized protein LOC117316255 n=1 Tax=Pecten maximus TaxID=6579 RepID=UPI0014585548|nr:uncharacterized protein LOC117316255 [Pecten maximus]